MFFKIEAANTKNGLENNIPSHLMISDNIFFNFSF